MGFFKKKVKRKRNVLPEPTDSIMTIRIDEIPRDALDIIYKQFMKEYEKCNAKRDEYLNAEIADNIQKQLATMSRYMRETSMKETLEYFADRGYPEEKLKNANPVFLKKMKGKLEDLDTALKGLYTEEPKTEKLDVSIKIETPTKTDATKSNTQVVKEMIEADNLEKEVIEKSKPKTAEERVDNAKEVLKSGGEIHENELGKKKESIFKKDVGTLFKKKKKIPKDEVTETIDEIKKKQPDLFTKKPDIKKIFKKKDKDPDIFCPDCKHLMKNHKNGCNKCGCLMNIEDIKQEIIISEEEKAKTVDKVMQYTDAPKDKELIEKQIKQVASMKNAKTEKPKPKLNPNLECTCQHFRKNHFEMTGFCTVKDCYCDMFRKYPHD